MINVSRLYIHPVKSMKGIRLSQAFARESGFTFDRDFMITTPEGTFITARKYPLLLCFIPTVMTNGIYIQAPDGEGIAITYQVRIFNLHYNQLKCGEIILPLMLPQMK